MEDGEKYACSVPVGPGNRTWDLSRARQESVAAYASTDKLFHVYV